MFWLLAIIWWALGMWAFAYDWTRRSDLTLNLVPLWFAAGATGPFGWIIAAGNAESKNCPTVILSKRKS